MVVWGWIFGVFAGLPSCVLSLRPFGDHFFLYYVFTELVLFATSGPFGDPLSGLPERGERATKGLQSRPLETCFFMRTPFRRALCQPSRNGAIDAIKSASALRLSHRLCVLRCPAYGTAYKFLTHRSRHEGVGISGAPPLVKIRAGHQCESVWYRYVKSSQHYPGGSNGGRSRGPRQSPTKWVWWGKEEQRSD